MRRRSIRCYGGALAVLDALHACVECILSRLQLLAQCGQPQPPFCLQLPIGHAHQLATAAGNLRQTKVAGHAA